MCHTIVSAASDTSAFRWGSKGFLSLGDAVKTSAETSRGALNTMFSSVGMSVGMQLGLLDVHGQPSAVPTALADKEEKAWEPKVENVSMEDFKQAAEERLQIIEQVCKSIAQCAECTVKARERKSRGNGSRICRWRS